jgi:hypothetical protein
MSNRIFWKGVAGLGLILAIAACGSNSDGAGSSGVNISQALGDSFFLRVLAVAATSPDDAEPRETDSLTATSPEDSEAVATPG